MLRFLTAGESHGKGLVVILEGMPAGVHIDFDAITQQLKRRQGGYGRERLRFRGSVLSNRRFPVRKPPASCGVDG